MAAAPGNLPWVLPEHGMISFSDPWFIISALALLVTAGVTYLMISAYIIRRMRSRVHEGERERQSIINNAPVGIWLVGIDRRYRFVNKTFCAAVGVTEEQFLAAHNLAEVLPADVAAGCEKSDAECFLQTEPHVSRETIPFVDGKLHTLEITKTRLVNESGEITGAIGVAIDVTDRLAAEDQLHQRLAHITAIARLSEAVSHAEDLESIYSASMHALRETIGCDRAAVLLFDTEGVIRFKAWHGISQHYRDRFTGHSPWTAEEKHAQPIMVDDTEQWQDGKTLVPEFQREGIRALAFIPLEYNGNLLGKFMVYYAHVHRFSDADLQVLQAIARHVGYAIGQKTAEERLRLSNCVFTHAREGIVITDEKANILEVNEVFTHITGYTRDEVVGKNPRIFQSGRQDSAFYSSMWQALLQEGHWSGEIWNRRKNGEVYAEMLNIASVRDREGQIKNYIALFSDISVLKKHQQQLEHIAHFDALTGLPNRVLLVDRLNQAMSQAERRNQSLAVVYLDLDGFKEVNDRHGHDVGDELLIALALRMKAALREGDTLARIGGDEFVAVLLDFDRLQDCEPVLARLLLAAAERIEVAGVDLQVSASIGVTLFPHDAVAADQLMRHADQAMYIAKQSGKNRYHMFDVEHDTEIQSHREKLTEVARGLAQREFTLYYQPKVNMKLGTVIGAEALIRWRHPERGLLSPEEFIPIIQEHRLESHRQLHSQRQ
ncbi:MAG TPA: diguanylate cyclase, partial [Turneriella sp.]|nr:diguanylate cyclase [Turneriella sp.]